MARKFLRDGKKFLRIFVLLSSKIVGAPLSNLLSISGIRQFSQIPMRSPRWQGTPFLPPVSRKCRANGCSAISARRRNRMKEPWKGIQDDTGLYKGCHPRHSLTSSTLRIISRGSLLLCDLRVCHEDAEDLDLILRSRFNCIQIISMYIKVRTHK